MTTGASRAREVVVGGLRVVVAPGVCNPAPFGNASFARLYQAALVGLEARHHVLDLGTGCGIWALLAARTGARVTATDLPGVDLGPIEASALRHDLTPPRVLEGHLFEPVDGERFDRVVFNPPFHLGVPRDAGERAYLGGADGEVVRAFLAGVAEHLTEDGSAYVILPSIEREAYERDLAVHAVEDVERLWLPVLGRVHLLKLSPRR